jgi:hydrocephalus-inducing protein
MGRDPDDQPQGILYEVVAESCIPGIAAEAYESIFEEQIVVASLSSGQNIANLINSNVFSIEEKTFFFGTLVPSKAPEGTLEKFKIINPNKIPCTVKFDVRKRSNNAKEEFAFEVATKSVKIPPHEHTYVKVLFKPTIMASYAGLFEAIVENGESNPKTHKLVFDMRGEGALPTLKLEKPKEWFDEKTPILKFPRTKIGKNALLPIMLKNDGQVPATVKFELNAPGGSDCFRWLDPTSHTLPPKTYQQFQVEFLPKEAGAKTWAVQMSTLLNPYENSRVMITGEGFYEDITFEGLPNEAEEEISFGDCIINTERRMTFFIRNNSTNAIKFNWNTQGNEDFTVTPRVGHLEGKNSKPITILFKSSKAVTYKSIPILCETKQIIQPSASGPQGFQDWDDSKCTVRYVTQNEYDWVMKKRVEEESKRREEEAATKKGAKKAAPADKKAGDKKKEESVDHFVHDDTQEANIPLEEPIPEPDHKPIDKSDKNIPLKCSAIADFARYESETREIMFRATTMYTSRVHKFKVRNTSLIMLKYKANVVSAETAQFDPGFFSVVPKSGTLAAGCDEVFSVKFSPTEVEDINERLLVIAIENLDPNQEKLIVELDGDAERPVCHFELPPSNYREKKPDIEAKYNIVEFDSLGMKVKNTKRFYVVNPTNIGYEFEWKRIEEDRLPTGANPAYQGFFKCTTQKGVILSGKKFEMVFEYSPEVVGVHESYWVFEIPSQNIIEYFFIVGTVIEPNVFIDVGKVNFGPLLIGGKNKEIVKLRNLEHLPISFQFDKESLRPDPDYGDSLSVMPMSGVVNPDSDIPIEIRFAPKVERSFNYNLQCFVKRKSRPIFLNVKGIGYILHHKVLTAFFQIMNKILFY